MRSKGLLFLVIMAFCVHLSATPIPQVLSSVCNEAHVQENMNEEEEADEHLSNNNYDQDKFGHGTSGGSHSPHVQGGGGVVSHHYHHSGVNLDKKHNTISNFSSHNIYVLCTMYLQRFISLAM
ncbi:hypothetical protein OROMI_034547 [Orobanche minor]